MSKTERGSKFAQQFDRVRHTLTHLSRQDIHALASTHCPSLTIGYVQGINNIVGSRQRFRGSIFRTVVSYESVCPHIEVSRIPSVSQSWLLV